MILLIVIVGIVMIVNWGFDEVVVPLGSYNKDYDNLRVQKRDPNFWKLQLILLQEMTVVRVLGMEMQYRSLCPFARCRHLDSKFPEPKSCKASLSQR